MKRLLMLLLAGAGALGSHAQTGAAAEPDRRFAELPKLQPGEAVATFAGGSYWSTEPVFERLKGVRAVVAGHAGGTVPNPTYEQVSRGGTGHAESVQVYYNPAVISYARLLQVFFAQHNPTTLNRQGPDEGPEYRSVAFYRTPQEKQLIEAEIKRLNESRRYPTRVVTQVVPFRAFYPAERYLQNYFSAHPEHPYSRIVAAPRYQQVARDFPELLKPGS
ncbi:peptide-methionine (S)-S-oxide reductase MsrA [Hymenobacter latericus]|uniref:peptide-methionine (S)-S-oxide reductase MsrA n=1 Tax=Hymenobacter sp. YIM 151858-1 TaxID=2987688 RepID=UPI002227B1C4|nr:peptide-methionine (S)-S-oxide reductase MsrA [Hymenobacter sp. YIM 151858-1]UYZ57869.1 peptide-methionine (S)-S-oxide reductase MsrA [Hymenobacter sp. YIM 151858-1]